MDPTQVAIDGILVGFGKMIMDEIRTKLSKGKKNRKNRKPVRKRLAKY